MDSLMQLPIKGNLINLKLIKHVNKAENPPKNYSIQFLYFNDSRLEIFYKEKKDRDTDFEAVSKFLLPKKRGAKRES